MKNYVFEYAADRITDCYSNLVKYGPNGVFTDNVLRYVAVINKAALDYYKGDIEYVKAMHIISNPATYADETEA